MDRASELRALMKAKSGGGISGKDKAKYLKTLREGKKEEAAVSRPTHSNSTATLAVTSMVASTDDSSVTAKVKQVKVFRVPSLTAASSNVVHSGATAPIISGNHSATSAINSVAKLVTYDDEDDEETTGRIIPSSHINSLGAGPPAGFFDDVEIVVSRPFSQPEKNQRSSAYPHDSASEVLPVLPKRPTINAADEYTEHLLLEAAAGSAIPSGFFDDPLADLKARGVDIKKIEKKQEKREEAEFQSFLGALEVIQDDGVGLEKEEADEEKERIMEEELMQLNYERKVAVLLHKSDKVINKLRNRAQRDSKEDDDAENLDENEDRGDVKRMKFDQTSSSSSSSSAVGSESSGTVISAVESMITAATVEGEAIFESILGSSDSLIPPVTDLGSVSGTSAKVQETSVKHDVAQFLRKKKAENKQKLSEALTSDYNPLDFMDWTARSL